MDELLVNKVANSGLVTINMEGWCPEGSLVSLDIKDFLFHGLILKEKEFRAAVKEKDWSLYEGQILCVFCSTDAIIPVWAFMLIAAATESIVKDLYWGTEDQFLSDHFRNIIHNMDISQYQDQRIVIKGCSQKPVPPSAYMDLTRRLKPFVQSILYGEPCSTVPVYKKPK
jgi:hypothetical protein